MFYPQLIAHGVRGLLGIPAMLPVVVGPKIDLGYRKQQKKMVGHPACQLMLPKPKIATLIAALVRFNNYYRRQWVTFYDNVFLMQ